LLGLQNEKTCLERIIYGWLSGTLGSTNNLMRCGGGTSERMLRALRTCIENGSPAHKQHKRCSRGTSCDQSFDLQRVCSTSKLCIGSRSHRVCESAKLGNAVELTVTEWSVLVCTAFMVIENVHMTFCFTSQRLRASRFSIVGNRKGKCKPKQCFLSVLLS
jgi:hypothetical protein